LESSCYETFSNGLINAFDCGNRKIAIVKITSKALESEGKRGWRKLEEICSKVRDLRDEDYESIAFTVPEYPYLLLSGEYGEFYKVGTILKRITKEGYLNAVRSLTRREVVTKKACAEILFTPFMFFDEFHAYSGQSLFGALALLAIYSTMPYFRENKVAISSATRTKEFEIAKEVLEDYEVIEANKGEVKVRGETEATFNLLKFDRPWPGVAAFAQVETYAPTFVKSKIDEIGEMVDMGRKVVIIVDKIATVYEIYKVVKNYIKEGVVCVTSMSDKLGCGGNPRVASVIIGNEAISYGIDIKGLDYGIITAKTWYQLVQRVGRLGRSSERSKVHFLFPRNPNINKNSIKKNFEWDDFIEWAEKVFPPKPWNWYVKMGLGRKKVEFVLNSYKLITYIAFRDKFGKSAEIKRSLERLRIKENIIKEMGESKVDLHLGALATFLFSSFRGEGDDLIVEARNFKLVEGPRGLEIDKERLVRGYLAINVRSYEDVKDMFNKLKDKVVQLDLVVEALKGKANLTQVSGSSKLGEFSLSYLSGNRDPVVYLKTDEGYMRYLLSVESAIGIVTSEGGEYRLKGVLVRA